MASTNLSDMPWLLTVAWQATFWLTFGVVASLSWSRRPARAHRLLALTIAAALVTPLLNLTVRQMNWGLVPTSTAGAPAVVLPVLPPEAGSRSDFSAAVEAGADRPLLDKMIPPATTASRESRMPVVVGESSRETARARRALSNSIMSLFLWTWAVLSGMVLARLLLSFFRARQLVAQRRPAGSGPLQQALSEAARRLGLCRVPLLSASPAVRCPVIWCWGRRPVLMVPQADAETPSSVDWLSVFCHELAHWKRGRSLDGIVG